MKTTTLFFLLFVISCKNPAPKGCVDVNIDLTSYSGSYYVVIVGDDRTPYRKGNNECESGFLVPPNKKFSISKPSLWTSLNVNEIQVNGLPCHFYFDRKEYSIKEMDSLTLDVLGKIVNQTESKYNR